MGIMEKKMETSNWQYDNVPNNMRLSALEPSGKLIAAFFGEVHANQQWIHMECIIPFQLVFRTWPHLNLYINWGTRI